MLLWCIKVFILSALIITLGHFLLEHFNEQTTHPKIYKYDETYKKILNVLEKEKDVPTEQVTIPLVPDKTIGQPLIQPVQPQQLASDTTSIVNLPVYEEPTMEESLKHFMVNNT